jgi:hypothetical protein
MARNLQLAVAGRKVTPRLAGDQNDYEWRTEKSHHCKVSKKVTTESTLFG